MNVKELDPLRTFRKPWNQPPIVLAPVLHERPTILTFIAWTGLSIDLTSNPQDSQRKTARPVGNAFSQSFPRRTGAKPGDVACLSVTDPGQRCAPGRR